MSWLQKLKWTHGVRMLGVLLLFNESFLRPSELAERPTFIGAAITMILIHEVYKREKNGNGKKNGNGAK